MPEISNLVVNFSADISNLQGKMNTARRTVNRATRDINRDVGTFRRSFSDAQKNVNLFRTSITRLLGPLATLVSVRALAGATAEARKFGAALVDTSAKLGVTTSQLQELRFAAEQNGVAQNTLDLAIQRFVRRLGEAAQGTGELRSTLQQYNIAVRDASGSSRDTIDVLRDLADTIAGAESQQERLRIAFKAFDSEGAAFVNVLQRGSAGLDELFQSARDAGVVLDAELAARLKRADDRMTELNQRLRIAKLELLTPIAEGFVNMASAIDKAVAAIRDFLGLELEDRLRSNLKALRDIEKETIILPFIGDTGIPTFGIGRSPRFEQQLREDVARDLTSQIAEAFPTAPPGRVPIQARRVYEDIVGPVPFRGLRPEQLRLPAADRSILFPSGPEMIREIERVSEAQQRALEEQAEAQRRAVEFAERQTRRQERAQRELNEATREWGRSGREAGRVIGDELERAIFEARSFRDVLRNIIEDLARLVFRQTVTSPLAGILGTALTSFAGSLFGGGAGGAAANFTGEFDITGFEPGQFGGHLRPGQRMLVGEVGPELFVPRTSGELIPNNQLGGGGPSIFIDNRGADHAAVVRLETMLRSLNMSFEERAISAVTDARHRDPHIFS